MIEPILKSQLEPVARRHRQLRYWRKLTACWGILALVGLACLFTVSTTGWNVPFMMPLLAFVGIIAAIDLWFRNQKWEPDYLQIARQIEQRHPELHALLVTAVEQKPDAQTGKLSYLQQRVIQEAVAESEKHEWLDAVSSGQMLSAQLVQFIALLALVFVGWQLRSTVVAERAAAVIAAKPQAPSITVTPGDVTLERGVGMVVLAKFTGALPAEATLVIQPVNQNPKRIPLVKNLDDPTFGSSIPEVTSDMTYRVEYAGQKTRDFTVKVFEYPRLDRADAKLKYPDYTKLPEKTIPETRRISAVEGSSLQVDFQLNKPVKSASLIAKDKSVIQLATTADKATATLKNLALTKSQVYELQLVDADGRTNKVPAQFFVDVLKNRPPDLKFKFPKGDQRVTALQEISFQAEAWDDFGLKSYGLTYTVGGKEPKQLTLGENSGPDEKKQLSYLLKLEELGVKPDDLISWFLWADDVGPDGKVRRTSSDMFFAEVRPFEQIFRQGESKESEGGGESGNKATKLAELQKQIISATWKLQRQETATNAAPSAKYKKDAPVVRDSQAQALDQTEAMAEQAENPRTQVLLKTVEDEMKKAVKELEAAQNAVAPLPAALRAEQAAYSALLKLAAREFQVSQNRSKNSKGQQSDAQREQLDQLELKPMDDRYEKQSKATAEQTEQQKEELQVLNRLKELAQRQQDINERLKELQTALQEAKTDQEREEIRRRLKRLQEEEQQMLADIDELKQKMQKPENQSQMAEERKQLEKTRSEVQKAAEAMDKASVPQSLAQGTRAQRDLQDLRDEFRKKHSKQFSEEMRNMRNEARELAQQQEDIGKQIAEMGDKKSQKSRSLSEADNSEKVAEQLAKQQTTLTNLLDSMRRVSEQAEAVEPLLAKELYDTIRRNAQTKTEESLKMSEELVRRSYAPQAAPFEQRARKDIDDLKQGVEKAAESVLGDETEALRLARKELDKLTEQLASELGQVAPQLAQKSGKPQGNSPGENGDKEMSDAKQPGKGEKGKGEAESKMGEQGDNGKTTGQQARNTKGQPAPGEKGENPDGQPSDQSGKKPGTKPGEGGEGQKPGERKQPGQQASNSKGKGEMGEQPGKGAQGEGGTEPGQSPSQQAQSGKQPGQSGKGGAQASNRASNSDQPGEMNNAETPQRGAQTGNQRANSMLDQFGGGGGTFNNGGSYNGGPMWGGDFVPWSDRLRNVEEMLDQPELRNEAARLRELARAMRAEAKKVNEKPKADLVNAQLLAPLAELRSRVNEELARREAKDPLVPIDRDPVPGKFTELVRRYYEELGRSK